MEYISAAIATISEWFEIIDEWCHKHEGLGGWVGAVGAIVAIFVAWGLARSEYRRDRKIEREKQLAAIETIQEIMVEFNKVMETYFFNAENGDPIIDQFYRNHMNDAEFHYARDLAHMPVMAWPSIVSYRAFKEYWFLSIQFLEIKHIADIAAHSAARSKRKYEAVIASLTAARQGL